MRVLISLNVEEEPFQFSNQTAVIIGFQFLNDVVRAMDNPVPVSRSVE